MALEAIEPRRLYRQVADQLRSHLDSGAFSIGDRMPTERELAEQLNVSRPTIREALIALEVEGRIRIRVGSGIYVCEAPVHPPARAGDSEGDYEGPYELMGTRILVEGAIMAEAASLAEPAHIAALDAILDQMARHVKEEEESLRLDRAFHVSIASILGNSVTTRLVGELFDKRMSPYFGQLAVHFETDTTRQQSFSEHRAIRNALAARDPVLARDTLRRHLASSRERFFKSFGEELPAEEESNSSMALRLPAAG